MSRIVVIGLVQGRWLGSVDETIRRHVELLRDVVARGAQVVAFQELFNSPYFCQMQDAEFFRYAERVPTGPTIQAMMSMAEALGVVLVIPIFERGHMEGLYYNSAAVIDADGSYVGTYRKIHIPQLPGFWEKFYFRPGDLGYRVFDTRYGRVGVYICYDRHFPEGWRCLGLEGADIVFNPSATSRDLSSHLWQIEQPAAAVANGYFVGAINRVGREPFGDNEFYGNSYVCDPTGRILGGVASSSEEEGIVCEVDLSLSRSVRRQWQWYRDRRPDTYKPLVEG